MDATEIIKHFKLKKHPEGGYYKEVYRSENTIDKNCLDNSFSGDRNYCTSIYFLMTSENFSAFHKINQDEIWHFYKGTALKLHMISPDGKYSFVNIGSDFQNNDVFQFTVPAKHYFAAEVIKKNSFAFVGCTVAPGFDFDDFYLPKRDELLNQFPNHKDIITKMTR